MQIRLFFNVFATTQLFSPLTHESKKVRDKLQEMSLKIQPQLKKIPRVPSKKLPVNLKFTYFVNKSNHDPNSLLIITYRIIALLGLTTIIQDINNKTVKSITLTISSRYVDLFTREGCLIDID